MQIHTEAVVVVIVYLSIWEGTIINKSSASPWVLTVLLSLSNFLYSYDTEFMQSFIKEKRISEAQVLHSDMSNALSIENAKFASWIPLIYTNISWNEFIEMIETDSCLPLSHFLTFTLHLTPMWLTFYQNLWGKSWLQFCNYIFSRHW